MTATLVMGGIIAALVAMVWFLGRSQGAARERTRQLKANADAQEKMAKVPRRNQSDVARRMRKRGKRSS